eukprot:scaffold53078_cov32-Cyclotella_meneghiniana.AAC.5
MSLKESIPVDCHYMRDNMSAYDKVSYSVLSTYLPWHPQTGRVQHHLVRETKFTPPHRGDVLLEPFK